MKKILFAAALVSAAMFASCSSGSKDGVLKGSLSKMDTLSYALGANIGYGIAVEMSDVPFDFKAVGEGIQASALGEATQPHEEAVTKLRDFFMTKRGERAQAIAMKRAQADSVRMAGGDSTKMEYPAADPAMFESEEERASISYAFGQDIGNNIKNSNMPIHLVWISEAMQNVRDKSAKMTEDQVNEFLQTYFSVTLPAKNTELSKTWLEKMGKKSGVKSTESGLLYKVTKAGDAEVIAKDPRDVVKVQYTGRTRTGKVFDTSRFADRSKEDQEAMKKQNPEGYNKSEPVEFPLNRVIPGWTEGLQLVGKGGTITLWIPAELAYGARGAGRDIGPNEALQFDVEVVDVIPYVEPTPAPAVDSTAMEVVPVQ